MITLILSSGLIVSSAYEGVLKIPDGIGLLENLGLMSTLIGNVVLPYLTKRYYDEARRVFGVIDNRNSSELNPDNPIIHPSVRHLKVLFLFSFVGLAAWTSNLSFHLFGDPVVHWGSPVFDSIDHPASFVANRVQNIYSWVLLYPVCGYVIVFSTFLVSRQIRRSNGLRLKKFDLLHYDRHGGYRFVERANLLMNLIGAVILVQVAAHSGTFQINPEHILSFAAATVFLLFANTFFFGAIFTDIDELRRAATHEWRDRIYKGETLGLEVLRYYEDARTARFSLLNLLTRVLAITVSIGLKLLPFLKSVLSFAS
ncbi:MAG: hypothetical protein MI741_12120 [Rhodospirillales bacterium]|nr:hypothetical protein [Rhodospirillales bacterium]